MSELAAFLSAGAAALEHELGAEVTLMRRGEVYWRGRASWVQQSAGYQAEPGGPVVAMVGRVLVRRAVCAVKPREGDRVTVAGVDKVLVVSSVITNIFDAVWSLEAVYVQ